MKTLIIVESPSKIKKIKEILGNDYNVIACFGHIKDLAKGGSDGIGIDIVDNFKPKYILLSDKLKVIDNIINEASEADEILLCSDQDREGNKIAYDLSQILKSVNKPIYRAEFNEITKVGIEKGIKEKHDINLNIVKSQEARRILDRIVGFTVSPMLTNMYNNNLSAGRVQSVAARMIVNREEEIQTFKPEEYWTLSLKLKNKTGEAFTAKYDGKIKNKDEANNLVSQIEQAKTFTVQKVKRQQKKEKAPPPLITASLQQVMAKKGMSPEQTMRSAQSLYESGAITYHRTDSTRTSDEAIEAVRTWIKKNGYEVPRTKNTYASKANAQEAHECIRPTNINSLADNGYINGDEKEVYSTIWKFFIASQMQAASFDTLNVKIALSNNQKLTFKAMGKALTDQGFLAIFGGMEPGKIEIPNLVENEELTLSGDIKPEQKFTQPPPRFNDATLLKELESKGIGRPSTFADICKKISNRHYVEKQGGNTYHPTELGKEITNYLSSKFSFMEYSFTASIEEELDKIADGKMTHLDLLKKFYGVFSSELFRAYREKMGDNNLCPKCNNNMLAHNGKYGRFFACVNVACRHIENIKAA